MEDDTDVDLLTATIAQQDITEFDLTTTHICYPKYLVDWSPFIHMIVPDRRAMEISWSFKPVGGSYGSYRTLSASNTNGGIRPDIGTGETMATSVRWDRSITTSPLYYPEAFNTAGVFGTTFADQRTAMGLLTQDEIEGIRIKIENKGTPCTVG